MSRVHISYVVKENGEYKSILDVVSPDFSEGGRERQVIGQLHLDYKAGDFQFFPESNLASFFCPPEYFKKYAGDIDKVDAVCKKEGLMCTAWSYRLYCKAMLEFDGRSS